MEIIPKNTTEQNDLANIDLSSIFVDEYYLNLENENYFAEIKCNIREFILENLY